MRAPGTWRLAVAGGLLLLGGARLAAAGGRPLPPPGALPREVVAFRLKSTRNTYVGLADYPRAKGFVVVFTCNHCPFAKLYTKRLNDLSAKYQARQVPLLVVNSMDTLVYQDEGFAPMRQRAVAQHYAFPYLQDPAQLVGRDFGAVHTPQAFIIWKEGPRFRIRYSGAIDDNGAEPAHVAHPYLTDALDALLRGQPVPEPETASLGCAIYYRK